MIEQTIELNSEQSERTISAGSERSVVRGIDGVSPIATVTQTEAGATISITDRDGITTADIKNGKDGKDGTPGTPGKDGKSATISVGTTTTGNPGTNASVSNSGTASAAILNFTIPRGATGATGAAGRDGTDGRAGKDGQDGFSPTATVTKSGDTATIRITDKNGTTTAQIKDGTSAAITVDSAISSTSTNPVQNKVISSALNAKANPSDIPTKTSQLTNNSNFVVDASYTHTDNNFTATYKNRIDTLTDSYIVSLISDGTEVRY